MQRVNNGNTTMRIEVIIIRQKTETRSKTEKSDNFRGNNRYILSYFKDTCEGLMITAN